jgi:hypothetical protein
MSFYRPELDRCPKCDSVNTDYEIEIEIDDPGIDVRCECKDCGEVWFDRYTYKCSYYA